MDGLVDLRSVEVDMDLPLEERRKEFLRQIKNPHLFLYDGYVVEIVCEGE